MKFPTLNPALSPALRARTVALFACSLLLCACGSAPIEHYYTLRASQFASGSHESPVSPEFRLAIASVTLPEAVDRSELVLRSGPNSVMVMETQRWAESLKSAIPRAIADDVSQALGGATVAIQSDNASHDANYLLYIDITRFDSILNEAVAIDANWSVRRASGEQLKAGRTTQRVAVHGAGFEDIVVAHVQALAEISGEIAAQIKTISSVSK
jgi:uncharacterized lipoprotein YmbA